jgi:hypothetical protein
MLGFWNTTVVEAHANNRLTPVFPPLGPNQVLALEAQLGTSIIKETISRCGWEYGAPGLPLLIQF